MKIYATHQIKNIAVLGASKSGKTTLVETMLFEGGAINRRGTIEEKNTVTDFHDLEHERGNSIFSALAHVIWRDVKINLIDTPGNDNFSGDIVSGLRAADTAMFLI